MTSRNQASALWRILATCAATLAAISSSIAQTKPKEHVPAEEEEKVVVLSNFDVTTEKQVGYGTTNAQGATRMNLSIADTPNSVVVINRELMNDLGVKDALDILKYASGVTPQSTLAPMRVMMRGQEITLLTGANVLDGLPGGFAIMPETEFLDRIEFIKGPSGTLYGSHSLAGIINRVSKRPLPYQRTEIKGSYDTRGQTKETVLDTTGPLGSSGFSYRLVGVVRRGEMSTKGAPDNKEAIYAYISYSPKSSPDTRFWARYNYQHIENGHESVNWFADGEGKVSTFLGDDFRLAPAASRADYRHPSAELGYETMIKAASSTWNMRLVGRFDEQFSYEDAILPTSFAFYDANGVLLGTTGTSVNSTQAKFSNPAWTDIRMNTALFRRAGDPDGRGHKQYGAYLDLVGDFVTGPFKHKVLFYGQASGAFSALNGNINYSLPTGYTFSVINPVYVGEINSLKNNPVTTAKKSGYTDALNYGVQENLFMFQDRLILVGGAAHYYSHGDGFINEITNVRDPARVVTKWVYKAGAIVKPLKSFEGVSVFYGYNQTFTPVNGTNLSGVQLVDLEGRGNEVGVKLELPKQGLVLTAAAFRNSNKNFPIAVFNPVFGRNDQVQIGTTKVKGWEADLAWQPNQNISLMLAVSDVDARNPVNQAGVGPHPRMSQSGPNYRAVGKYRFTSGPLERFSVGAAFLTATDRPGDPGNTFIVPGYNVVDLFMGYELGRWKVQLNVENLADKSGVYSSVGASLILAQPPRSTQLSLNYTF